MPSPVSRNQTRQMKGVTLFKKIKELRENTERLNDVRVAFREEAEEEEELVLSTLSATSPLSLVCEVLPLLSKCHPNSISATAKELVRLPWGNFRGEEAQMDSDGEEIPASYIEDESRPVLAGTIQIDVPQILNGKARSKKKAKPTVVEEDEDDDEIEEFD